MEGKTYKKGIKGVVDIVVWIWLSLRLGLSQRSDVCIEKKNGEDGWVIQGIYRKSQGKRNIIDEGFDLLSRMFMKARGRIGWPLGS